MEDLFFDISHNSCTINRINNNIEEKENSRWWVRVAGISGFLAITLAVYGDEGYYY